jgi:hypothetical protein
VLCLIKARAKFNLSFYLQIDNPAYKGKWIHPMIDNPEYNADAAKELGKYDEVCKIGFDLWQVKSGTIFDNVLITDDPAEAKKIGEEVWKSLSEAEKKMKDEQVGVEHFQLGNPRPLLLFNPLSFRMRLRRRRLNQRQRAPMMTMTTTKIWMTKKLLKRSVAQLLDLYLKELFLIQF